MEEGIDRFNVRVYFLLIEGDKVLLADEIIAGRAYTKFPGGGLEFGEGTEDCAKREAMEELGQEIELKGHLYTTGFFQRSAFRSTDQVLSIYYLASLKGEQTFRTTDQQFDFTAKIEGAESFRWVKIDELQTPDLSFPIDRVAWEVYRKMLQNR